MKKKLPQKTYARTANDARKKVLELIYKAQTSHIGSNFSAIDLMTVIFERLDFSKDKFVLSAGWKAAALYFFLWKRGRMTLDELNSYCQPGSKFIGLAEPVHPDIPFAGGSMGMGLPAAVGFALAKKLKGEEGTVYCLMSDGELQIGTTWESALIAAQHKLNNLAVIVDCNGYQAMGKTNDILPSSFPNPDEGWDVWLVDGHNYGFIEAALNEPLKKWKPKKPSVLWANTIKGKGVSFMENNNLYHYKQLSADEYNAAMKELT